MKIKHIYTLIGLISVLYFGFTFSEIDSEKSRNKSIIKFSHSTHDGTAVCDDCHSKVSESIDLSTSLLPEKDNCADCHDVEDEDNCEMCHYEDVYETLIPSTAELFFNHKFHLEDQEISCEKCHAEMFEYDYSFENAKAKPGMDLCFTCHNNISIASNACEQCHTSTNNLYRKIINK